MKKSVSIIILILLLLGAWIYFWKDYILPLLNLPTKNEAPVESPVIDTGSIADILPETNTGSITPDIEIPVENPLWYTWGGVYGEYSAEAARDAILGGKDLVLYFHATRDPTDEELDKSIRQSEALIPENSTIFKVDFDKNDELKTALNITDQNTLVFLDSQWAEKTRRSKGITSLSQIVDVILDR